MPNATLFGVIVAQWLAKVVYEAAGTPLVYAAVAWLKAREGVDTYDRDTNFNPFARRQQVL